jgi:methionine-rich copper-binding protein CopC
MKINSFLTISFFILFVMFLHSCGQLNTKDEGLDSKSIEEASGTSSGDSSNDSSGDSSNDNSSGSSSFTVSSVSPADNLTNVSVTTSITITFSENVSTGYSSWTTTSTSLASCSGGSFNWKVVHVSSDNFSNCIPDNGSVSGKTVTLNLNRTLSNTTSYKIRVLKTSTDGSVTTKSTSGTQLSTDYTYSFTTQ